MLVDIFKALAVLALYLGILVGGITLARWIDRRRREPQGGHK